MSEQRHSQQRTASAFTLVELLVVIFVISVLIALLLPALSSARKQSNLVHCSSNLAEIYKASLMYANDNGDRFPDAITTGNFGYRMQPGMTTPGDPAAEPELYGLAAVFHGLSPKDRFKVEDALRQKPRYMDGRSKVWICPGQNEFFQQWKNTYAFSIASGIPRWTSQNRGRPNMAKVFWVYDNYVLAPGLSGFRGPFTGYTLPVSQRRYPHTLKDRRQGATNVLYFDGHIDRDQIAVN